MAASSTASTGKPCASTVPFAGSCLIVTALFNDYGTAAAVAAGIGLNANTFVTMPCWAAGQAVTTMAGHSMGAGDPD